LQPHDPILDRSDHLLEARDGANANHRPERVGDERPRLGDMVHGQHESGAQRAENCQSADDQRRLALKAQ
jgi:hypothetical protein